jgi:hypothetical protein
MATQSRRRILDKPIALRKVHVFTSTGREESIELEADLRHMGCLGLLEKSLRVRCEEMVRELVTGRWTKFTLPPSGADRIGGMHNCGVGFMGSSREGKVWPLKKRIALGISSLRNWTPNMVTL